MTFVLLDVGCLECGEPTNLLGVYKDKDEALAALNRIAAERVLPVVSPSDVGDPGTAVALAGTGGSYWYQLQLHQAAA